MAMTELDELEEINLGQNPHARPDKRMRTGRRNLAVVGERLRAKPKWMRQLRASKAGSSQKAKP